VRVGALGLCNVGAIIVVDTYYDTLGVSPAADDRDIRIAFRRLAKQFHPDFNAGDEDAARCFKELSCAYKVLRDPRTRAAYDAHLEQLRAMVARDRCAPQRHGAAPARQFWREARRMAASCLIVSICLVAFGMSWGRMTMTSPSPGPDVELLVADAGRIPAGIEGSAPPARIGAEPVPMPGQGSLVAAEGNDAVPAPQLNGEALAQATRLVTQGERYLSQGNIAVAREFFERAADLGLPIAAMKMAETYDPAILATRVFGPKADPAEARKWYERAMALGLHDAEGRLRRLDDR